MLKDFLICSVPALLITLALFFFAPDISRPPTVPNFVAPNAAQEFYAGLQNLRGQLDTYKFEHNDRFPDFANHGWTQLTTRTDSHGQAPTGGESVGPYLRSIPTNPFTNSSQLLVVPTIPAGFKAQGAYGYVFEESTSRLFALNADGRIFTQ